MRKNMPLDKLSLLQKLNEYGVLGYVWILAISVWGGVVRYLVNLKGKPFLWSECLSESIVSGFVGVITGLTCQYYDLDTTITLAIVGMSSHHGTRSLYLIAEFLKKNISKSSVPEPQEAQPVKLSIRRGKNGSSNRNS